MNRRLIILIVFTGLFSNVYAQSPSAAIDSLIKYKIITAKQRPLLEKELKDRNGFSDRIAILGGLENVMLQKEFHVNPRTTGLFYSYNWTHLSNNNQDSINTSLRLLLNKINRTGLLTGKVYTNTLRAIDSGRYVVELQMIRHLAEMSARLEWLAPDKLLPVAQLLHQNGIVSDSSFLQLEADIKNNKIESSYQLTNYCKLARTFDLTKYFADTSLRLEQFHRDIAAILPDLNFTDFSYTTTQDSDLTHLPTHKFNISLTCNGRVYKHSGIVLFYKNKQGQVHYIQVIAESFYPIFNKILADENSPYRLHNITFSHAGNADNTLRYTALIALREEQTDIFWKNPCLSYMLLSMENYDSTLTSVRVDTTIAGWRKAGLFDHLSDTEIEKGTTDAESDELYSINNLLFNFPNVIYSITPPMLMRPTYPYNSLLTHLAIITHGAFNPTQITQRKIKDSVNLKYLFKGKIHSYTFSIAYGFLDTKFPEFLKTLRVENNLPGSFYELPYEEAVIYLTKEQYEYLTNNNLLDFGTHSIIQR